jgi:DNA-binding LacI/PurR family transcriptional regulator
MIGRRVGGIAVIVSEMDPKLIDELTGNGIPVVFYDVGEPRKNITCIRVNYRRGMEKLVSYLYSLGHRELGFVGHHSMLGPIDERLKVVIEARKRYPGLQVQTAADSDSLEGGRRATRTLLDAYSRLTAIVCVNDLTAVGAMRELRDRGLRIPEDVSVTGFDNVELAQFCYLALTSVHIPRDRIGQIICSSLLSTENAMKEGEVVIDPEVVLRDSTGPAADPDRRCLPAPAE